MKKPERGMLDGIKSKLGFADSQAANDQYYDDEFGDDYQEYGDYGDYGEYGDDYGEYGTDAADEPTGAAARYDSYTSVTTRPARGTTRTRSGSRGANPPALVSIDDVRAHTQVPDSLMRDPLPARHNTSSYRGERTMVDASLPSVHAATPAGRAAAAARGERSESLNSLFSPTDGSAGSAMGAGMGATGASDRGSATSAYGTSASSFSSLPSVGTSAAATQAGTSTTAGAAFDPYEAYAGSGAVRHSPARSLTVLKPASYAEVERVAKALKAGDAVILALRNTPDNLAKRILDFSFGVSSALDANVECVADKVFAVTRGAALTDDERMNLRSQGVL